MSDHISTVRFATSESLLPLGCRPHVELSVILRAAIALPFLLLAGLIIFHLLLHVDPIIVSISVSTLHSTKLLAQVTELTHELFLEALNESAECHRLLLVCLSCRDLNDAGSFSLRPAFSHVLVSDVQSLSEGFGKLLLFLHLSKALLSWLGLHLEHGSGDRAIRLLLGEVVACDVGCTATHGLVRHAKCHGCLAGLVNGDLRFDRHIGSDGSLATCG